MVLAHMHPNDLTWLSIHSEKSSVVDYLHRLRIRVYLPFVVGQNVFNDECYWLGGYILEKVFLLYHGDLVALHHTVPESFLHVV
jgi:hypothetical protein